MRKFKQLFVAFTCFVLLFCMNAQSQGNVNDGVQTCAIFDEEVAVK